MSTRKLALIAVTALLIAGSIPAARAGIFTGTCALNVSFDFDSPIRSVTQIIDHERPETVTTYDVSASSAADLNPLKPGFQGCAIDADPLDPFRGTSASGTGTTISWTCEDTVASGSWSQDFHPDPAGMDGSHVIAGTWGNWVMVVNNPSLTFTGTINLTVAPSDAAKLAQCEMGGISSLNMVGVMHLQDPEV